MLNLTKHLDVIALVISLISLGTVYYQIYQSNNFKRYENYNHFNKIYDDWYKEMPDKIKDDCNEREKIEWSHLENDDRAWIRRYFDLYSQEYYLYLNDMIPKEMWEKQVHGTNGCNGAAILNLREYPILIEGYKKWEKMGAFKYPVEFTQILDKKIKECKKMLNEKPIRCSH